MGFEGDDGNEMTDPITPHLRAIDAINPEDVCFQEAYEHGVTTVCTCLLYTSGAQCPRRRLLRMAAAPFL